MSFEPREVAAKLRQLSVDMNEIGGWLISNYQIERDYSRRGGELLTAAIVAGFWANDIEARIIKDGTP